MTEPKSMGQQSAGGQRSVVGQLAGQAPMHQVRTNSGTKPRGWVKLFEGSTQAAEREQAQLESS